MSKQLMRTNPNMRCFMFTLRYRLPHQSWYGTLNVELAVSDGTFPGKSEILDLGKVQYARYHKQRFNLDPDLDELEVD